MDPTQKECGKCGLYRQRTQNELPEAGQLAWAVYSRLASPAAERFGLHGEVLRALGLRLSHRDLLQLVGQLDEILIGIADGRKELTPPPPARK